MDRRPVIEVQAEKKTYFRFRPVQHTHHMEDLNGMLDLDEATDHTEASVLDRMVNFVIDHLAIAGISGFLKLFLGMPTLLDFADGNIKAGLLFAIQYVAYFLLLEGTTGRTLGKVVTKTEVVSKDGYRVEFGPVLIRTFCRLIPFEPFSFMGSKSSGWHDTLSKTKVVKRNR